MKALAVKVNWWEGWGNDPVLQLLVDELPPLDAFRFDKNGAIYYAELDGYVRYYAYSRPGSGFGGRHFCITMKDGKEVILEGPWSSRPGAVHLYGFGPCVHVSITDDPLAFERGYTFFSGDVTLAFAQGALSEHLPDVELVPVDAWGERNWIPRVKGQPLKESARTRVMQKGEER